MRFGFSHRSFQGARQRSVSSGCLRVGFVPLCECAPIVVAHETGLFKQYGLKVELVREVGWATIREKMVHGRLDAAHALAGMPFAATLGWGSIACPCVTGWIVNLQGNAITLARQFEKEGVHDAATLGLWVKNRELTSPLLFGIVSQVSSHRYLIESWLKQAGLQPERHYRLAGMPPPQMPYHLEAGHLAGYCVGEPWNWVARELGVGWCPAPAPTSPPVMAATGSGAVRGHGQTGLGMGRLVYDCDLRHVANRNEYGGRGAFDSAGLFECGQGAQVIEEQNFVQNPHPSGPALYVYGFPLESAG